MFPRRWMLAAPMLAGLVACADSSGPSTPPPASVLGCYDLTVSTWSAPERARSNPVFTQGGFIGIRIGLQWAGSRWSGQAEAFTDVAPPVQATTLALLVPTPCS